MHRPTPLQNTPNNKSIRPKKTPSASSANTDVSDSESDIDHFLQSLDINNSTSTTSPQRSLLNAIQLVPFVNQVGGHAAFLRFSEKALCKPLDTHERDFYEELDTDHSLLAPFVPIYLGVVNVRYPQSPAAVSVWGMPIPEVILEPKNAKEMVDGWLQSSNRHSQNTAAGKSTRFRKRVLKDAFSPQNVQARQLFLEQSAKHIQSYTTRRATAHDMFTHNSTSVTPNTTEDVKLSVDDRGDRRRHSSTPDFTRATNDSVILVLESPEESELFTMDDLDTPDTPDGTSVMQETASAGDSPEPDIHSVSTTLASSSFASQSSTQAMSQSIPIRVVKPSSKESSPSLMSPSDELKEEEKTSTSFEQDTETSYINPWSLHMYASHIERFRDVPSPAESPETGTVKVEETTQITPLHQFLLLEDLTYNMKHPSILDLKMGTRQHGIGVNQEKRESQLKKVHDSTSASLGVRLCGMQVFNCTTNQYHFQDKYLGRRIRKPAKLQSALQSYLDDGHQVRVELIPSIVSQLKHLRDVVSTLNGYRFFASSLLLIYDALPVESLSDNSRAGKIYVRMVDFANCVTKSRLDDFVSKIVTESIVSRDESLKVLGVREDEDFTAPDTGYILGLCSLIRLFESISHANLPVSSDEIDED